MVIPIDLKLSRYGSRVIGVDALLLGLSILI
jgi:hypothetical protein